MSAKQQAKEHSLDIPHISCIEFPLKVKNVEKAFDMVGGADNIIQSCLDDQVPLELRFTKNIYEHPVNAKVNKREHILIKISVPKKEFNENNRNIQKTLEQLHTNGKKQIHITPLAIINKTFRFREMSDFQYQVKNSEYVQQVNESIHSLNFDKIKELRFEQDTRPWDFDVKDKQLFDLPPPPRFSSIPLPFNYHYKKNAASVVKEGKLTRKNKHIKLNSIIIKFNDEAPKQPSIELLNQLKVFQSEQDNPFFKDTIITLDILKKLFDEKPIWIRKHLEAILPNPLKPCLKYALPQISYSFTKGPWRQSYIKFGIDPRTSPKYGKYQTEGFRVPNYFQKIPKGFMSEIPNGVSASFQFDGTQVPLTLSFQLENILDEQVQDLLKKAIIRTECDFQDGWYDALSMFKVRRLMRYKLKVLVDGGRFESDKISHIMNNLQVQEANNEKDDGSDDEDEIEDEEIEDYELDVKEANYDEIVKYLEKFNERGATQIKELSSLIKQKDLDI
ncbi:hypothetical protein WICANDRAFT_84550 [Wickerhamomyces anomalus NRRL Y-366-8]|uniref:Transcription factor IIIC subunit 5 HTH domain-containing protein n=1 Tax=Wickerhamomyces anomalus (strain ATCC 58044 / CBS 1984 / NCYC 433 / NRRL Y-366-8) TaxID=683960 RepID=A0A1E3P044_WICAA|nr:uncharacterized protein WICANDRAFT_84550 [Wickerhamomyces anomalus NRRL Y-366-8]ODQ58831.1 hypothetical protein WICANDRAFT_84550 [Wickerhamomyces anomalus NRRL Y-366-8]